VRGDDVDEDEATLVRVLRIWQLDDVRTALSTVEGWLANSDGGRNVSASAAKLKEFFAQIPAKAREAARPTRVQDTASARCPSLAVGL
jgi:hypothetical protein